MDWTLLSLNTLVPQIPKIVNDNFTAFKTYMDVYYDESGSILIKPLTTTGKVKGGTGEFVNAIVDNLTVKNQYTNLYSNVTTANYDWYTTYDISAFVPRDACTTLWENPGFSYIDAIRPYFKINNDVSLAFQNSNLSQVVEIIFDPSITSGNNYSILLNPDPSNLELLEISASDPTTKYLSLTCTAWDASWGPTWTPYHYGNLGSTPKTTQIFSDASFYWDITQGYNSKVTLDEDKTLYVTNVRNGDSGTLIVTQDSTGSRTLTFNDTDVSTLFQDGSISLTGTANSTDILSFLYDSSTFYWNVGKNYYQA